MLSNYRFTTHNWQHNNELETNYTSYQACCGNAAYGNACTTSQFEFDITRQQLSRNIWKLDLNIHFCIDGGMLPMASVAVVTKTCLEHTPARTMLI